MSIVWVKRFIVRVSGELVVQGGKFSQFLTLTPNYGEPYLSAAVTTGKP